VDWIGTVGENLLATQGIVWEKLCVEGRFGFKFWGRVNGGEGPLGGFISGIPI